MLILFYLGVSSNNAALAAESLIDDGNKVIELFPDGHKDFNEMLLQESFAVNKMESALNEYFQTHGEKGSDGYDNLIKASRNFCDKSSILSDNVGKLLGQLSQSPTSESFLASSEGLEQACQALNKNIMASQLLQSEKTIEDSLKKLRSVGNTGKTSGQDFSISKQQMVKSVKEIFTMSQELKNAPESEYESKVEKMAIAFSALVDELATTPDMEETSVWTEKLGKSILMICDSVRKQERPQVLNVGETCAKILTSLNAVSKKDQVLDDVGRELLGLSSDLETTILFASAGTLNSDDGPSYPGLCSRL